MEIINECTSFERRSPNNEHDLIAISRIPFIVSTTRYR